MGVTFCFPIRRLVSVKDTSLLLGSRRSPPSLAGTKQYQLEAWGVFCTLFLGDDMVHPTTYEIFLLLEETSVVSLRLRAQARQQPTFPAALLCLIRQESNEIFCQALERRQRVR